MSQILSEVIMYKWSDLLRPIGGTSVRLTAYSSNRSRRASYDLRHFSRTVWHTSSGRALLFVTSFKSSVVLVLEITRSLSGFPDHVAYKKIVKNPGQIKSQNYSKAKKNNNYYYYHRGTLTSTCSSRPKNNNCKKKSVDSTLVWECEWGRGKGWELERDWPNPSPTFLSYIPSSPVSCMLIHRARITAFSVNFPTTNVF